MAVSLPVVQLPTPQVFTYRTVSDVQIEADVYWPIEEFKKSECAVFLNIHGGGWMSGTRKEANQLMVYELLKRGIIVTSIDYRLLPEVSIDDQFDDIRAAEDWARVALPAKAEELGWHIDSSKVLVGGNSAGGHLAMMVPHLWKEQPLAILAFYGPTDFTTTTPREKTVQKLQMLPPLTPEIVKAAIFDSVQTSVAAPTAQTFTAPRSLLYLERFRSGGIGEFVAAGLTPDFELRKLGSLPIEEVKKISPSFLPLDSYPPLFHVMGTEDQIFAASQATEFAEKLAAAGVASGTLIVRDGQHGFDMIGALGGETHTKVILPAIEFICQTLVNGGKDITDFGLVEIDLPEDAISMP